MHGRSCAPERPRINMSKPHFQGSKFVRMVVFNHRIIVPGRLLILPDCYVNAARLQKIFQKLPDLRHFLSETYHETGFGKHTSVNNLSNYGHSFLPEMLFSSIGHFTRPFKRKSTTYIADRSGLMYKVSLV